MCRLSDAAHAGLLTISVRCLARASLSLPASEAVTLPKLAGDQVAGAVQRLEACAWRSEPVRGMFLVSTDNICKPTCRTADVHDPQRPRVLTLLATGVLDLV